MIDIPDEDYKFIKDLQSLIIGGRGNYKSIQFRVINAIRHGTPFPKRHGRLIDADEALNAMDTWDKFGFDHTGCFVREPKEDCVTYVHYEDMVKAVRGTPTIIEADKEKENG